MLCIWSPPLLSVNSFINNVKSLYKFDRYLDIQKKNLDIQNEELCYVNTFIKQLKLSPRELKIIKESFKSDIVFPRVSLDSKLFRRQIRLIIKRNFHTERSFIKSNKNVESNIKSEELQNIMKKFQNEPHIQNDILEAYKHGSITVLNNLYSPKSFFWSYRFLAAVFVGIFFAAYTLIYFSDKRSLLNNVGGMGKILQGTSSQNVGSWVDDVNVTFSDVQGCDEVKKDLQDVVYFLKNPSAFIKIGAKLPKGVLLHGEPGLGKTLLARAVAGEAGVPFVHVSGSQFDELFVGLGASRIRSLFNDAKERSPCVVFIDELDAIGGKRVSSAIQPHANQTINQLLAEMDGFEENEGVIVIGATNRLGDLDKAILRPGRFDLKIKIHPPDYRGRLELFKLYLSKVVSDENIDIPFFARSTIGFSGADIRNLVNQAAIICTLKGEDVVNASHLLESEAKLSLGSVRNRPSQEKENRITAYHEAGHAIVTYFSKNSALKLKMVTILPRGGTGGHNSFVPKFESNYNSKAELMAQIDCCMGGRAAEELLNGKDNISTGASADMKNATDIARRMVQLLSMSDEVGLQVFDNTALLSPKQAEIIDAEVNRILKESYDRAKSLIEAHRKEWEALATNLLQYESLNGDDVELIINGKKPKIEELSDQKPNSSFNFNKGGFWGLFSSKDGGK